MIAKVMLTIIGPRYDCAVQFVEGLRKQLNVPVYLLVLRLERAFWAWAI
jgi:hypothetical protein